MDQASTCSPARAELRGAGEATPSRAERGAGLQAKHGEQVTLTFTWYQMRKPPNTRTLNVSRRNLTLGPKFQVFKSLINI